MIGKGTSIAHTKASMSYGWNQEKQTEVILKQHVVGENPKEITKEFQFIQEQNYQCKKNTLSFVLSPTIEDGKRLNQQKLQSLTQKFIKEMQLKEHQAIAFVHRDKQHTHVHLYVNRIDFNGKAYNDSFIGKKSQLAAERVAKELGLTTAREVQQQKLQMHNHIRKQIQQIHHTVIKEQRPKSIDQYIEAMKQHGVKVTPSINRQGQLQGFRFTYKGTNLKASEVHRQLSGSKLIAQIHKSPEQLLKIAKVKTVAIGGTPISLAANMALKLAKKTLKQVLKKSLDIGMGI